MRSELTEEPTNRHQNQFVEDIGQSVANALFGYNNASEEQTAPNEEDTASVRPKRSAKKVQQVRRINQKKKRHFLFRSVSQ